MNGETKFTFKGAIFGALLTLILATISISFGYGALNSRVRTLESKITYLQDIRDKVTGTERDVAHIKEDVREIKEDIKTLKK